MNFTRFLQTGFNNNWIERTKGSLLVELTTHENVDVLEQCTNVYYQATSFAKTEYEGFTNSPTDSLRSELTSE